VEKGRKIFPIESFQGAGDPQKALLNPHACIEVMTGSVLPKSCDCVVPYEDVTVEKNYTSLCDHIVLKKMQNIHQEASDFSKGAMLIPEGSRLYSPHYAVAASLGKSKLWVSQVPKIAVVSTGDELVDIEQIPKTHQIRRSNPYAILAALQDHGFGKLSHYHLNDEKESMKKNLQEILQNHNYIVLSGGVSKGKKDFLPEVFVELHVEKVFHRVRQKPGKPFYFGKGQEGQIVFALPGNPVSTLICFYRYVLPALQLAINEKRKNSSKQAYALLRENVFFLPELSYFLPVSVEFSKKGEIHAFPHPVHCSGDFASLMKSDGFIELPADQDSFLSGESFPLFLWTRFN
jgi:molybdopterin molybdotransferase